MKNNTVVERNKSENFGPLSTLRSPDVTQFKNIKKNSLKEEGKNNVQFRNDTTQNLLSDSESASKNKMAVLNKRVITSLPLKLSKEEVNNDQDNLFSSFNSDEKKINESETFRELF